MQFNFTISVLIFIFLHSNLAGQSAYFDKSGKSTSEEVCYYIRTLKAAPDVYESRYKNSNAIYFQGRITNASESDESLNQYIGQCTWYHKNGEKKIEKNYNDSGEPEGDVLSYYESGNIWKQEKYKSGKLINNTYTEYNEDGTGWTITKDSFENNDNDWDLYTSSDSESKIEGGIFSIKSKTPNGSSRYISMADMTGEFVLEAKLNISKVKMGQKAGIIFGFKDWENYSFFSISNGHYSIARVFEGITSYCADNYMTSLVTMKNYHTLKILVGEEKILFSINGTIIDNCKSYSMLGNKCGFVVGGKESLLLIDDLIYKKPVTSSAKIKSDADVKSSGTGFFVSADGFILTNYHVIEKAKTVQVEFKKDGNVQNLNASIVISDKTNDLALLKIDDPAFVQWKEIPFGFKSTGGIDVGTSIYTIGYPLALSGMGKDAKFSDGKISAKTGYQNSTNSFQSTIPVQPGNSGGPVLNMQGEVIGVINATVTETDNVSYAIKCSNIFGLLDLADNPPSLGQVSKMKDKPLEEQIKIMTNYVVLIKVK